MPRDARFWRNVTIIAVAHLAVIIALVRWNHEARKASLQSIVWMNADAATMSTPAPTATVIEATPAAEPLPSEPEKPDDPSPEAPTKSDILPPPTPVPTSTPKPTITPTPVPKPSVKPTAKPTPKPTPKKTAEPKATPRPSPKKSVTPSEQKKKSDEPPKAQVKVAPAHADAASDKSGSTDTSGAPRSSEFSWYGKMLHDRFFSEWVQPTSSVAAGSKMSAVVRIRIEKDGRISNFTIVKPSGNVVVDESVAAVAKRVTQVDPLPRGLGDGAFYEVNINFALSQDQ
ncbi:MAG: TonB family protein [Verrucomicrobiota bacterium]|nr:TonB family protein [Verrucomicrobiota bacterium]